MKIFKMGAVICAIYAIVLLSVVGCTDGQIAKFKGLNEQFKIELLSVTTGEVIRTWVSTGKVSSEASSDGYFFMDKNTGKLTEVSGCIVITNL